MAAQATGETGQAVLAAAQAGFLDGLQAGCLVASAVALAGAVLAVVALPARPVELAVQHAPTPVAAG